MDPQLRPRRAQGIEIHRLIDGFVVYQPDRDRVHHFNHAAMVLLELCDGSVAAGELPGLIGAAFRLDEAPIAEVEACLRRLLEEGLVKA